MASRRDDGAGRLRHLIVIEQAVTARDGFGEETAVSYERVRWAWAEVTDLQGREWMEARAEWADVTTRIRLRWRPGIRPTMRARATISGEELVFNILAISHDGRGRYADLMCQRVWDYSNGD